MLHLFKKNGYNMAIDRNSGEIFSLSELTYRVLEYLKPPISPRCPVSLRYNLANYTSDDVTKSYGEIYALYKDGRIFADPPREVVIAPCEAGTVRMTPDEALKFVCSDGEGDIYAGISPEDTLSDAEADAISSDYDRLAEEMLKLCREGKPCRLVHDPAAFSEGDVPEKCEKCWAWRFCGGKYSGCGDLYCRLEQKYTEAAAVVNVAADEK